jgi:hypothetical protein
MQAPQPMHVGSLMMANGRRVQEPSAGSESAGEHTAATRSSVNMGACNRTLARSRTSTLTAPRCQDETPPGKPGYLYSKADTGNGRKRRSYSALPCSRNTASARPNVVGARQHSWDRWASTTTMKSHYWVLVNWVRLLEHSTWWVRFGEQRWVNFCERQGTRTVPGISCA